MTSHSAERYLSAALLNKDLRQRLCDVDAMVDAITDYAIVQLDANGNVVRWCPGAQALMGYAAADVLDRPVSMFYTEEDRAAGLPERELAVARESGRLEFEGWRTRCKGERFRAGVVLSPIRHDTDAITGFTMVFRDVTAEHQRAENMFVSLLESAPDAMVIVGSDGRILLANAQTDRMFGYPRQELIGSEVEMLMPPSHRGAHQDRRTTFFADPRPRQMGVGLQLWGMHRCGAAFPVEVSLSPLRTDQGVLVSAAIRDMTERLAVQHELSDARAQAEVSAERDRIASELQDHALQRVFAVGLVLQSTALRVDSTDVRQRLDAAVDDLHTVVQDFRTAIYGLQTSSTATGGLRERLDGLIGQLSGELATTVQYKGPLSVVEPPLAEHAEAVLKEAISNAVRHAEASKLDIAIHVADELCIDVTDNGKGMPAGVADGGLTDLRQRAEAVGGTVTIGGGRGGGTRLRWSAPLY
jgi:two-component system sensor histidine kinase DevS